MTKTPADKVTVRLITSDEFDALSPESDVFVQDAEFTSAILVPARPLGKPIRPQNRIGHSPGQQVEPPQRRIELRSVYGVSTLYSPEQVYVADPEGQAMPLMPSAGRQVHVKMYVPGMEDEEIQGRVREALRREFGQGVVELWNLKTRPVRDLRWDVYFQRRNCVNGEWVTAEEVLAGRAVRDGNQHSFMGREPGPGWSLSIRLHDPLAGAQAEVL